MALGKGRRKSRFPNEFILLVFPETPAVVFIKDGAPGVDVDDGHSARDEQHERELDHVADLHEHDGGDEGQHGDIVVILGVLCAAVLCLHPCSAVVGSRVGLEAAQLEARTMRRTQGQGTEDTGQRRLSRQRAPRCHFPQLPQKH